MALHSILKKILSAPMGLDRNCLEPQISINSDDNISANSEDADLYSSISFDSNEQPSEDVLIFPTLSSSLTPLSEKISVDGLAPLHGSSSASKKTESRDIRRTVSQLPRDLLTQEKISSSYFHDYDDIPYNFRKTVINNRKKKLTIALLNKTIFLDGNKQKQIPIRGCIILNIKKPTKIHKIELQLLGISTLCFYFRGGTLIQSGKNKESIFLKSSREWYNFKPTDDVTKQERWDSSDTFSKGVYKFPFIFTTHGDTPQSTYNSFGSIVYKLETKLLIPKKHTHHLKTVSGRMTLDFVQCTLRPDESDLGHLQNTDYVSTANWRNLLCYSVSISGPTDFAIGSKLNVTVKILPIIRRRYKILQIRIFMVQKLCYDSIPNNKSHYADIIQTEKLPLILVNVHDAQDCDDDKVYSKKFSIPIDREYCNACSNERFVIYPSTSSTEKHTCHFKVRHEFIVGIVVQEIEEKKHDIIKDRAQDHKNSSVYHEYSAKGSNNTINFEIDEENFIRRTADLIKEPKVGKDRFKQVELLVAKNLHILRPESKIGNRPPPSYSEIKNFTKVEEKSNKHPPSYEEHTIASHILPPTYA